MCGITAIINLDKKETFEGKNILLMSNSLKHRGPDDDGFVMFFKNNFMTFYNENKIIDSKNIQLSYFPRFHISTSFNKSSFIFFGFRRLAIQDLSYFGHQPMSYRGRYWIVFNGEIYNYIEIKNELLSYGYEFFSNSDTEVILAAFDKYGLDCLNKFNGMWAFIIYDSYNETIFISRDRFGIKPLYYSFVGNQLLISSEIKGILANPNFKVKPNFKYLEDFIRTYPKEYIEETAFENIFKFPKASYSLFKVGENPISKLPIIKYYFTNIFIKFQNKKNNFSNLSDAVQNYNELLKDSIRLRLRSDAPLGTSLSGGIDSSSIVYWIKNLLKGKNNHQKTFSLSFENHHNLDGIDESKLINLLVNKLDIDNFKIEPSLMDVKNEYLNMVYAMENPQDDMLLSCMFTYKLYKMNNVKVAIDGQGADELLGGYLRYLVNYFSNLPLKIIYKEYRKFKEIPNSNKEILAGVLFNFLSKMRIEIIALKILRFFGKFQNPFFTVEERMLNDFNENLENLLHYGDRSSMFYSVESRFPFMDYRFVEFCMCLPTSLKLNEGWTKFISRKAVEGKLPDEIVYRKDKMGWEIPQKYWFEEVFKEFSYKIINESLIVKQLKIENKIKYHWKKRKKSDYSFKYILKIFNLCLWYEIFINNNYDKLKKDFNCEINNK
ncbi:MAG: asparagine synthase (glutamine-hydrolyzing) [Ignavibacteria bacterium]|jgi:asparagine synthase (glutamine-hydrolysing)|nr:asparagine synthase (glutamine-hydrolyzing) [Ignavibacteria bacterium]MDH7527482.1 asparagine synthase (glutamine-hydrolyzing) [Ignavibacteria bacterium]